jgi:Na+/H+ antiporter NhaD/arsenite permease-like protein
MEPLDIFSHLMIFVFVIGYSFITIEEWTKINKATVALMMAIICWTVQFLDPYWTLNHKTGILGEHLNNISQVIFFLLGALTVVEIINVHKGFEVLSDAMQIKSKKHLLWTVSLITFFLSAILDNLTTTIVMITLLQKLVEKGEDRLLMGGAVVIAANAGGAWTPIGDVTTTMLWIGERLSTMNIIQSLFIPSIVCSVAAVIILGRSLKGNFSKDQMVLSEKKSEPLGRHIFWLGIFLLMLVPVFKIVTGLPPFMGMLFALSVMWIITDILHHKYEERNHLRVPYVLTKIDLSGTLFFLGILLSIDALDSAGILESLAQWLDKNIGNIDVIGIAIGIASAVVDNVPLVAATMGMYGINQFPADSAFWELIAYCAGTGGSMLIIGSAAGVVFMGLEKVSFIWYIKRITLPAAVGYFAGIAAYLLLR